MNAEFEQGLRRITASSSRFTSEIGGYILDSGGKRLRPRLVLMMSEILGVDQEKIMPLAYSVELLHNASLLHDDVVDGTEIRRSRPTANQVFGDKPALLAGDFLSASALDIVFDIGNLEVASLIVRTIQKMAEGELLEIEQAAAFHANEDVYLKIIYLKTAALFELCTAAPAIITGMAPELREAVREFGRLIGMAFQIVDDIINVVPASHDDKDPYNDIYERKSTLPLIILFREQPEILERLAGITDPIKWQDNIVPSLTPAIFRQSRAKAAAMLDQALACITGKGLDTDRFQALPSMVLGPLDNRF